MELHSSALASPAAASLPPRSPTTLPGPAPMPIFGAFGSRARYFSDIVRGLVELAKHGPLVGLTQGAAKSIVALRPEFNAQILSNPSLFYSSDPAKRAPPDSSLGRLWTGLVSINGEPHKQQRKLMMPAFHKKRVESYRDDMVERIQRMLDGWTPGETRNIAADMTNLTLLIVTKALFGLEDERETLALGWLLSDWLTRFTSVGAQLFPVDRPGTPYRRLLRVSQRGEASIRDLIARKRAQGADGSDVLSMLLHARDEAGGRLSDAELVGQTTILFIAGHETTAYSLSWALFLLEQHPAVLAALVEELEGTLHGGAPTLEQLEQLPLLDRVIKESMRLLTPVPMSVRIAQGPFEMGGYGFEAGTQVTYSPYITHRLPELYPEPQRFNPDRWINKEVDPYGYIPFSSGPRRCIGATMALLEIKLVLSMLLPRYRLALAPNARIDRLTRATLRPKYGMPMVVHAQDKRFAKSTVRGNLHEMVDLR